MEAFEYANRIFNKIKLKTNNKDFVKECLSNLQKYFAVENNGKTHYFNYLEELFVQKNVFPQF